MHLKYRCHHGLSLTIGRNQAGIALSQGYTQQCPIRSRPYKGEEGAIMASKVCGRHGQSSHKISDISSLVTETRSFRPCASPLVETNQ